MVQRVELHVVDPPRKGGIFIGNTNAQVYLELAVPVLDEEHLLLRAEPVLPVTLVDLLRLEELELELGEESSLGELGHEGLSAHGVDAVCEIFIGVELA